jgi:flagellin-specific chaperone FliS
MAYPTATVNTYKEVNINTASQGKLILMLFDGAIKRAENLYANSKGTILNLCTEI